MTVWSHTDASSRDRNLECSCNSLNVMVAPMATHRISYQVLNKHMGDTSKNRVTSVPGLTRDIEVCATMDELEALQHEGYLIRERAIGDDWLQSLRDAIDRLMVLEWDQHRSEFEQPDEIPTRTFGTVLRHLLDKDRAVHDLLTWAPALSIARAMRGPLVRLRGLTARVSFAGAETQETPWHQHLRVIPSPLPPWFSQPHAIDCLIYLDELNDDAGALSLVPGSHRWLDREPPQLQYEPMADEKTLRLPAGSMVIIHSNLWHRALPTMVGNRRMLILSYTPAWLRESPHGGKPPADGLTRELLANDDPEIRELLGLEGYS